MSYVQLVVEDVLQEAVASKLLSVYRPDIAILGTLGRRGNSYIKARLRGFNQASRQLPHIVLTDLDNKACAPSLVNEWIDFEIHPNLLFRIAVREVEAWLLADRKNFSRYTGISQNKIPFDTQNILDPKRLIITLARSSRKRPIHDLIPQGTAVQGPGYNPILLDFVQNNWNPSEAMTHNQSLARAVGKIRGFCL